MSERHNEASPKVSEGSPMEISDEEPTQSPIMQGDESRNDPGVPENEEVLLYPQSLDQTHWLTDDIKQISHDPGSEQEGDTQLPAQALQYIAIAAQAAMTRPPHGQHISPDAPPQPPSEHIIQRIEQRQRVSAQQYISPYAPPAPPQSAFTALIQRIEHRQQAAERQYSSPYAPAPTTAAIIHRIEQRQRVAGQHYVSPYSPRPRQEGR
ncbi:MAG: hypothetical protein Q9195_008874 [Heterodermia aff. obscurata]